MFQTKVIIEHSLHTIDFQSNLMTLGSCFADNIGTKMIDLCFSTLVNPFGVLYNPISISNSIELLLKHKQFDENDIFIHNSVWHSFSHSSQYSNVSQNVCLQSINSSLTAASKFLKNTDYLMVTFGTAWVFEETESKKVVSNCHKLPATHFTRRRLTVEEIVNDYGQLIQKIRILNPNLKFIFSISPIRHRKDGAVENNISKSTLLLAVDELKSKFENIIYFPAYEILMDELRDYRFYASDMLHPSDVAIEYIWERFSDTFFSDETKLLMKRIEHYNADLMHRPLFPESHEYKHFVTQTHKRKDKLISEYPILELRLK